jgi:hypothetical protein
MPSEPLSMCSVCGRPPGTCARFNFNVTSCRERESRWCNACLGGSDRCWRGAECERIGRERAESRLAEALEALRKVGCLGKRSGMACPTPWGEPCVVCRVLAGTPPGNFAKELA